MKRLLFGFLFATVVFAAVQQAHYRKHGDALLNDATVTPGVVRTTDASEICDPSFRTKPFRLTTQLMKNTVYIEYGVERNKGICKGGCEVDHLIPLELGGLDDVKNLWPQPSQPLPGFHEKDKFENYLRHHVCIEKDVKLTDAQTMLRKDWYQGYLDAGLGGGRAALPLPEYLHGAR